MSPQHAAMPFIANTPESLVGRSDSKNPATTCRGITSSGRPCRRPVAAVSSPAPLLPKRGGLRIDDPSDEKLYCWQHKEQASISARSSPGPRASQTPILEERTSLDTLADRLGILEITQHKAGKPQKPSGTAAHSQGSGRQPKMTRHKPKSHIFCCSFKIPIEEVTPPVRPKPQVVQPMRASMPPGKKPSNQHVVPGSSAQHSSHSAQSHRLGRTSGGSSAPSSASSQTAQFLSLIPGKASPQTASGLMTELAKSISLLDEPGYIYMFWLTPETEPSAPPAETARSLLAPPPSAGRPGGQRRVSDVLASYAAPGTGSRGPGSAKQSPAKILLKIGRATNVQRRLNEWTRQCGYNLSLIRYYPYISSSSPGPVAVPRKMPHSHKVERLIHIELAGAGLRAADREKCDACGREHREWFEVDASRKGVMEVDEVIRRWVDWDEGGVRA